MIINIGIDKIIYTANTQSITKNINRTYGKYKVKTFIYPFKRIKKFIIYECFNEIEYSEDYIGEFQVSMLNGQVDTNSICFIENESKNIKIEL